MSAGAAPASEVKPVTWGQSIINRHNAWNKWTVETFRLNKCCSEFLRVHDDSGMIATALKVLGLFVLSHLVGPIASTIKSAVKGCYNGTTSLVKSCWNKCCCKSKPAGATTTEGTQEPKKKGIFG